MSDTLRVALVAEGVTDYEVIRAAIDCMLDGRAFSMTMLQPDESVAFSHGGDAGPLGGGWRGVYTWCLQSVERNGGGISKDVLFDNFDVLVLHLDADVADENPSGYRINPVPALQGRLPCGKPCPPAAAATDPLRAIMLEWIGETTRPTPVVLCTPSKNTECWVVASCFPNDSLMRKRGWECYPTPQHRLSQQPIRLRFDKSRDDYRRQYSKLREAWPRVSRSLSEATRFASEFAEATS